MTVTARLPHDRRFARALVWAAAAVLLWIAADRLRLQTPVEVYSDGGRVRFSVAGSVLEAPVAIASVTEVTITAADAIDPPGGTFVELAADAGPVLQARLPARFQVPQARRPLVGDWSLDETAPQGVVGSWPLAVDGPFVLRAGLTGRFLSWLRLTVSGAPTTTFALRRGLINDDMMILDARDIPVAVTSIDPTPLRRATSAFGTLLFAASAATMLVSLFTLTGAAARRIAPTEWPIPNLPARTQWAAVILLAVIASATSAWTAGTVLERLPHTPDEVTYLLQARWLLAGRTWMETLPYQELLSLPLTHLEGGRWIGHYPPGWPLLLAAGVAAGAPWLVTPLLAAGYVVLLFLVGRELLGPRVAMAACLLATLSPMARLMSASMLAHAAAGCTLLLFLWLLLLTRRRANPWLAAAAGASLGCAVAIRPQAAVAVGLVGVLWLIAEGPRGLWRRLVPALSLGLAVTVAPTLLVNLKLTGNALSFPATLTTGPLYGFANIPFGLQNLDTLLVSTSPALFGWMWGAMSDWPWLALPLALPLVPLLTRRPSRTILLLCGCCAAIAAIHLGTRAHGLHGFGPRYVFDGFFCLYLLAGEGFAQLARLGSPAQGSGALVRSGRWATSALSLALLGVLSSSTVVTLPQRLALFRGYNGVDGSLESGMEALGLDRGIILFAERDWRNWARAASLMNRSPDAELVFADLGEELPALIATHPDRPVFLYESGTLRPFRRSADAESGPIATKSH